MRKTIIIIIAMVLLSISVQSQYYTDYQDDASGGSDWDVYGENETIPWYAVYDWELEECRNFAGTVEPANIMGGTITAITDLPSTSLTLQGLKTELPAGGYIYEIAWYIQPVEGDIDYDIILIPETGADEEYVSGFADAMYGDSGYEAFESEEEYTHVKIEYNEGEGELEVEIVESENYY